jgi:DNA-binding CsgD family transcriptional regulator
MSMKRHPKLDGFAAQRVRALGCGVDLPLFSQEQPPADTGNGRRLTARRVITREALTSSEATVLNVLICYGPHTDRELAQRLEWTVTRVSTHRNNLVAKRRVLRLGTKFDTSTQRRVALWDCDRGAK